MRRTGTSKAKVGPKRWRLMSRLAKAGSLTATPTYHILYITCLFTHAENRARSTVRCQLQRTANFTCRAGCECWNWISQNPPGQAKFDDVPLRSGHDPERPKCSRDHPASNAEQQLSCGILSSPTGHMPRGGEIKEYWLDCHATLVDHKI